MPQQEDSSLTECIGCLVDKMIEYSSEQDRIMNLDLV
jgi:hypothetical protein